MQAEQQQAPPAPPLYDLAAEEAFLGAALIDPDETQKTVLETFAPTAFYLTAHQQIAEDILVRWTKGDPVDPFLLRGALLDRHLIDAADMVLRLAKGSGSTYHAGAYWARILALADRREKGAPPPPEDPARALVRSSFRRFTYEQLISEPPPIRWILKPYIPAGRVITLAGPGGSNKTTLTTYLALCRATGRPFYGGNAPSEGRTAILTTEDGFDDYWRRLAALRDDLQGDFDPRAIAANIVVFDLAGERVRFIESDHGMFSVSPFVDHFANVLLSQAPGVDLLIVETVSRVTGGIETNESLSVLVSACERLTKLAGVAVILIAHVSQEAARNGYADANAPRGGSALGDNGRSTLVLTPIHLKNKDALLPDDVVVSKEEMKKLLVLTNPKVNGAQAAEPLFLERHTTLHGPVLHRASLRKKQDPVQEDTTPKRAKVVALVADLVVKGIDVSREGFKKNYSKLVPCAQAEAERLLDLAVGNGELTQREPTRGGRGHILVPTQTGAELAARFFPEGVLMFGTASANGAHRTDVPPPSTLV